MVTLNVKQGKLLISIEQVGLEVAHAHILQVHGVVVLAEHVLEVVAYLLEIELLYPAADPAERLLLPVDVVGY